MHVKKDENIVVVGAGVSGLVIALLLARQGRSVSLYDKRTVLDQQVDGRSINFTISGRGLAVLEQLKLKELVLARSAVLVGRTLHLPNQKRIHYKYGTKQSQVLLSIRRSDLIDILLATVAKESNISLHFDRELADIDESSLTCHFTQLNKSETETVKADWIVGADGVFSQVRRCILKKQIISYQQTVFNWGYKEYQFSREDAERLKINTDHMHMWPKPNALLVAIPNTDGTFSVVLTAPLQDKSGQANHFDDLVKREYSDIVNTVPTFLNKNAANPYNYIISVKIDKWHVEDKIILTGDACHATYPFYGQGMNSALEDAVTLCECINNPSLSRLEAFIAYEKARKKDTNALHQLSEDHLHQMKKSMTSPFWQARNMLDYQLAKFLPGKWVYEYEMVAHSTVSYSDILEVVKKQSKKKIFNGFYIIAFILGLFMQISKLIV